MLDELVFEVQRLYPQIYLACHVDHVRAKPTLSATIARLVRLGYITSEAATRDKRERELRLTTKGADAIRGLQLFARAARELEEES